MSKLIFCCRFFFFFNDTATTEIYTLSLHDALPICPARGEPRRSAARARQPGARWQDRKSTRLNSSHDQISYAVFCLKKNKSNARRGPLAFSIVTFCARLHTIRLL